MAIAGSFARRWSRGRPAAGGAVDYRRVVLPPVIAGSTNGEGGGGVDRPRVVLPPVIAGSPHGRGGGVPVHDGFDFRQVVRFLLLLFLEATPLGVSKAASSLL